MDMCADQWLPELRCDQLVCGLLQAPATVRGRVEGSCTFEVTCGHNPNLVPQGSSAVPLQHTVATQCAACHVLTHHPLAVGDLLLSHVQLTAHKLLDVQLEMLPPSLHAVICGAQLRKLPCGGRRLVLDVSRAAVLNAAAAALQTVQGLDSLVLTACRPTLPSLSFVGCLTALKRLTLNLTNCDFDLRNVRFVTDIVLQQMSVLPGLQHLDLAGCKYLTDQGLKHLRGLTSLQHLKLYSCQILTDQGIEHLSVLTALQHLVLTSCRNLTDQGIEHLSVLTALQHLVLTSCRNLTDQGIEHLSGLTTLQHLDFSRCPNLTNQGIEHLSGRTTLQHLDLHYIKDLIDQALEHLGCLTALHHLDLSGVGI
jgi:hypothetical protein